MKSIIIVGLILIILLSLKQKTEPVNMFLSEVSQIDSLPGDSPYLTKNNRGEPILSWVRLQNDSSSVFCYAVLKEDGSFENITTVTSSTNIYAHAENIPKVIFKP
ncbi:MAG: hypothetical protein J7497_04785, partial [Chitinophagaceae bacterium]|nr:hypothetical protein [Chitinophagaceae bacterium]